MSAALVEQTHTPAPKYGECPICHQTVRQTQKGELHSHDLPPAEDGTPRGECEAGTPPREKPREVISPAPAATRARAECPECHRQVRRGSDGIIWRHKGAQDPNTKCPGVGMRAATSPVVRRRQKSTASKRAWYRHLRARMRSGQETCRNCDRVDALTIDHLLPNALGGRLSLTNITILCEDCNNEKGVQCWPHLRSLADEEADRAQAAPARELSRFDSRLFYPDL